jgi:hypothetical protein
MAKTIAQIYLDNLEILISEAGTAAELAARAGTSSSYLSQIRRRRLTPSGESERSFSPEMARRLELACSKPVGWMDEDHAGSLSEAALAFAALYERCPPSARDRLMETVKNLVRAEIFDHESLERAIMEPLTNPEH